MEKFPVVPPEFIAGYVWAKYHPVYAEAVLSYAKYKKTKAAVVIPVPWIPLSTCVKCGGTDYKHKDDCPMKGK